MPSRSNKELTMICAAALNANGCRDETISRALGVPLDQVPILLLDALDHAAEGEITVPPRRESAKRRAALRG